MRYRPLNLQRFQSVIKYDLRQICILITNRLRYLNWALKFENFRSVFAKPYTKSFRKIFGNSWFLCYKMMCPPPPCYDRLWNTAPHSRITWFATNPKWCRKSLRKSAIVFQKICPHTTHFKKNVGEKSFKHFKKQWNQPFKTNT